MGVRALGLWGGDWEFRVRFWGNSGVLQFSCCRAFGSGLGSGVNSLGLKVWAFKMFRILDMRGLSKVPREYYGHVQKNKTGFIAWSNV